MPKQSQPQEPALTPAYLGLLEEGGWDSIQQLKKQYLKQDPSPLDNEQTKQMFDRAEAFLTALAEAGGVRPLFCSAMRKKEFGQGYALIYFGLSAGRAVAVGNALVSFSRFLRQDSLQIQNKAEFYLCATFLYFVTSLLNPASDLIALEEDRVVKNIDPRAKDNFLKKYFEGFSNILFRKLKAYRDDSQYAAESTAFLELMAVQPNDWRDLASKSDQLDVLNGALKDLLAFKERLDKHVKSMPSILIESPDNQTFILRPHKKQLQKEIERANFPNIQKALEAKIRSLPDKAEAVVAGGIPSEQGGVLPDTAGESQQAEDNRKKIARRYLVDIAVKQNEIYLDARSRRFLWRDKLAAFFLGWFMTPDKKKRANYLAGLQKKLNAYVETGDSADLLKEIQTGIDKFRGHVLVLILLIPLKEEIKTFDKKYSSELSLSSSEERVMNSIRADLFEKEMTAYLKVSANHWFGFFHRKQHKMLAEKLEQVKKGKKSIDDYGSDQSKDATLNLLIKVFSRSSRS